MSATRTQVYFTEQQRAALDERAARENKTMAEVVREAVDRYLADEYDEDEVERILDETFGAWAGKKIDVPSRDEWDRGFG